MPPGSAPRLRGVALRRGPRRPPQRVACCHVPPSVSPTLSRSQTQPAPPPLARPPLDRAAGHGTGIARAAQAERRRRRHEGSETLMPRGGRGGRLAGTAAPATPGRVVGDRLGHSPQQRVPHCPRLASGEASRPGGRCPRRRQAGRGRCTRRARCPAAGTHRRWRRRPAAARCSCWPPSSPGPPAARSPSCAACRGRRAGLGRSGGAEGDGRRGRLTGP